MSTAQTAANQANAQLSTGPRTPAGKAASAINNLRHGFTGVFRVLRWESQQEFETLLDGLRAEHLPSTPTETFLVDQMAQSLWLTKRAVRLQHETFNDEMPVCDDPNQLALYIRYQTTHERAFHRSLNQLLKLRAEKRKAEIGFESQERKRNEESQKKADQTRRDAAETRKQELHKWSVLLAQAKVDNQELQNMRLETPEHRIQGRVEHILAAENAA